jgi:hypothetical protein
LGLLLAASLVPNIVSVVVSTGCSPILGIDDVRLGIFDSGPDVLPSEAGADGPSNGHDTGADVEVQVSSGDADSFGEDASVQGADSSSAADADASMAEAGCAPGTTRCVGTLQQSCNGADGTWTAGTIVPNSCGAQCTPNRFQCGESAIGQVCSASGYWISNGSGDLCTCDVPGRFLAVAGNLAEDTTTGLKWDRSTRSPDTWTNASATCNAAGLRLPTMYEWSTVVILNPDAGNGGCAVNPTPFDQAAMPTTSADLACNTETETTCSAWSSDAEAGNLGYVLVALFQGSPMSWQFTQSDDRTTGINLPFRCVE